MQASHKAHKGCHFKSPPRAHVCQQPTRAVSGGPFPLSSFKSSSSLVQGHFKAHKGRYLASPQGLSSHKPTRAAISQAHQGRSSCNISQGQSGEVHSPCASSSPQGQVSQAHRNCARTFQGPQGSASHKPTKGALRGSASPRFLPFRASVTFSQGWSSPPATSNS